MDSVPSAALGATFRRNWGRLTATYGLTAIENVFELLYPFAIGLAIDGLLDDELTGLYLFIGIWIVHAVVGITRQRYDTRTFTRIYAQLATDVVTDQHDRGVDTSIIVARSSLSRELVDFFEHDVPAAMIVLFGFVGSLVMLMIYDVRSALYCAALLVPLAGINAWFARRSLRLNAKLNDQLEAEVDVLTERSPRAVRQHYDLLSKWRIKLSDADAANWGFLEGFAIVVAIGVFVRVTDLSAIEAGSIYAILSYLWSYLESLDKVPALVGQISRVVDIGRRVRPAN